MFQKECQLIRIRGHGSYGVHGSAVPLKEPAIRSMFESMLPQIHCDSPDKAIRPPSCFHLVSEHGSDARTRQFLPSAEELYWAVFAEGLLIFLDETFWELHWSTDWSSFYPILLPSHFPFISVRYALQPKALSAFSYSQSFILHQWFPNNPLTHLSCLSFYFSVNWSDTEVIIYQWK